MRDIKLLKGTNSVGMDTECNPPVAGMDPEAPHFWQHRMKVSNEAQNETRIGSARQHLSSYHSLHLSASQLRSKDWNSSLATLTSHWCGLGLLESQDQVSSHAWENSTSASHLPGMNNEYQGKQLSLKIDSFPKGTNGVFTPAALRILGLADNQPLIPDLLV